MNKENIMSLTLSISKELFIKVETTPFRLPPANSRLKINKYSERGLLFGQRILIDQRPAKNYSSKVFKIRNEDVQKGFT